MIIQLRVALEVATTIMDIINRRSKEESRLLSTCKHLIIHITHSVWINVVPPDGVPRRIAAFSGESLLDVIQRNNVPGIFRKFKD